MRRYAVRRPRASWFDHNAGEIPVVTSITVDDSDPIPTGLLDPDGHDIVRMPEPIGFVRFDS